MQLLRDISMNEITVLSVSPRARRLSRERCINAPLPGPRLDNDERKRAAECVPLTHGVHNATVLCPGAAGRASDGADASFGPGFAL